MRNPFELLKSKMNQDPAILSKESGAEQESLTPTEASKKFLDEKGEVSVEAITELLGRIFFVGGSAIVVSNAVSEHWPITQVGVAFGAGYGAILAQRAVGLLSEMRDNMIEILKRQEKQ